jgi:hypothetical protein
LKFKIPEKIPPVRRLENGFHIPRKW